MDFGPKAEAVGSTDLLDAQILVLRGQTKRWSTFGILLIRIGTIVTTLYTAIFGGMLLVGALSFDGKWFIGPQPESGVYAHMTGTVPTLALISIILACTMLIACIVLCIRSFLHWSKLERIVELSYTRSIAELSSSQLGNQVVEEILNTRVSCLNKGKLAKRLAAGDYEFDSIAQYLDFIAFNIDSLLSADTSSLKQRLLRGWRNMISLNRFMWRQPTWVYVTGSVLSLALLGGPVFACGLIFAAHGDTYLRGLGSVKAVCAVLLSDDRIKGAPSPGI